MAKADKKWAVLGILVGFAAASFLKKKSEGDRQEPRRDDERPKGTSLAVFNRNPGNIKASGLKYPDKITPKGNVYEQFATWTDGTAAMIVLLHRYITKLNRNTVRTIASSWCNSDPRCRDYAVFMSKHSGLDLDKKLVFNRETAERLVFAQTKKEDPEGHKQAMAVFTDAWLKFNDFINS